MSVFPKRIFIVLLYMSFLATFTFSEPVLKTSENDHSLLPSPKMKINVHREISPIAQEINGFEESLKWFIRRLKSFMLEISFDTDRFEVEKEALQSRFSDITESLKRFPISENLLQKYGFAKRMLNSMMNTLKKLELYSSRRMDEHFLRCILLLNVKLYGLFDENSEADSNLSTLAYETRLLSRYLVFWKRSFSTLQDVTPVVYSIFQEESYRASETLEYLKNYISRNKKT